MKKDTQLLHCLKRGLSGYISYLAACQMNSAFTEYLLYEPILRILTALGCDARCEVECEGLGAAGTGDKRRLDFVVSRKERMFALEVKWAKARSPEVRRDHEKLKWFVNRNRGAASYLCIFGRKSHLQGLRIGPIEFVEIGRPLYAEFGKTRYGCRIFEVR